jgi:HAD superfamily hydrolase (TIGR01549 family)
MIKAIVFDYDETLTRTIDGKARAYSDFAMAEYGKVLTTEDVKKAFGIKYEEFIKVLFGDIETVEKIIGKYQKFSANYPPIPYEGAIETVNKLFKKYLIGIVSGIRRKDLNNDLEQLGFDQKMFFHIQCGDETKILKPNPIVFEPLKNKLKLCQIKPEEVVYVGDSLGDMLAAKGAGFKFIGIAGHTRSAEEFRENGAEIIESLSELEEI